MTGKAEQIILYLYAQDKNKVWDVKEHKEKRSLSQNAYYWKMLSVLARKLRMSNARLHNLMLRDCAAPFIIGGKIAMQPIPDTDEAENDVLEAVTYHLKPSSGTITGNDGTRYRWYVVLRGSSTFNTAEMSALLDRLIVECKEQGIETLPDDEIERMRQYERIQEQKKQGVRDHAEGAADC